MAEERFNGTVFEAAGGIEGMRRLADAWHRRVMADEVVAHAFSHGFHPQHVERLAAYWAEALGCPSTYSDSYGDETTVVIVARFQHRNRNIVAMQFLCAQYVTHQCLNQRPPCPARAPHPPSSPHL